SASAAPLACRSTTRPGASSASVRARRAWPDARRRHDEGDRCDLRRHRRPRHPSREARDPAGALHARARPQAAQRQARDHRRGGPAARCLAPRVAGLDRRRRQDVTGGLRRELGLLPLAAVVFFNVIGGPYGIEDVVPSFGPGLSLLLLVLTPLVWSLPVSLVMSELASAMPDEGGYVTWVRRAYGPFWSFQVGWWSWLDSFVDIAVYPILFVEYVRLWWPGMSPLERWLLALGFIWGLTLLNQAVRNVAGDAALVALVVITLAYLLPVGAALSAGGDWESWKSGALPAIATSIGGPALGHLVGAGAVMSTAGLILSLLLTNSRLPYVLAREGQMAGALARVHRHFGTPWVAVIVSAVFYSAFAVFSFRELI